MKHLILISLLSLSTAFADDGMNLDADHAEKLVEKVPYTSIQNPAGSVCIYTKIYSSDAPEIQCAGSEVVKLEEGARRRSSVIFDVTLISKMQEKRYVLQSCRYDGDKKTAYQCIFNSKFHK